MNRAEDQRLVPHESIIEVIKVLDPCFVDDATRAHLRVAETLRDMLIEEKYLDLIEIAINNKIAELLNSGSSYKAEIIQALTEGRNALDRQRQAYKAVDDADQQELFQEHHPA